MAEQRDDDSPRPSREPPLGSVPKEPIREESITGFDRSAGDSSRALLWTVLVLVAAMLVGIFFCTEAQALSASGH